MFIDAQEVETEEAMRMILAADKARDTDDMKEAVAAYCKANPDKTFVDIENLLRKHDCTCHLFALEKEIMGSYTLVDLQGHADRQYLVVYNWGPKPRRNAARAVFGEENLERLGNAGIVCHNYVPFCHRCKEKGHITRECEMEREELPDLTPRCMNCGGEGHRFKDCTEPEVAAPVWGGPSLCRNCQ